MTETTAPATGDSGPGRPANVPGTAAVLWLGGLLLILLSLIVGRAMEDRLAVSGMPDFRGGDFSPAQFTPLLFAFAFPLGLALCAIGAMVARRCGAGLPLPVALGIGTIAVGAPVLVPVLLGRELMSYQFGTGGIAITLAALGAFWSLGRLRGELPASFLPALDLGLLGLLCFAAAAWNLCGSAAMPSFLLMPERLAELHTLPFAIGQMKSMLALLTLGWFLVMAAVMLAATRTRGLPRNG